MLDCNCPHCNQVGVRLKDVDLNAPVKYYTDSAIKRFSNTASPRQETAREDPLGFDQLNQSVEQQMEALNSSGPRIAGERCFSEERAASRPSQSYGNRGA